jgi:Cof subfamily protein (haloacid dehalogenase superfamily)
MINYNGALVWEPLSGQVLSHQPIPVNIARGIIKWARQRFPAMRVSAEIRDRWYTDFSDDIYQTETARLHKPDLVAPIEAWLTEPLTKLLLLGKKEWLAEVARAIAEDLPDEVTTVQTEGFLLQIMHAAVSKASAVRRVARHMGVAQRRVMAIGDNTNDADMIAWAGVGVAMANGHVASLQAADHITDHHDADGVASAISEIVLQGKSV